MRILIYGNSHVGAWRDAWADMAGEHPGIDVNFFSLPEKLRLRYRLRADGRFGPRRNITTEDLERIRAINDGHVDCDLSAHDVAVWVGADWHPERAVAFAAMGDPPTTNVMHGERAVFGQGIVKAALNEVSTAVVNDWNLPAGLTVRPMVFGRPIYAETCVASSHRLYEAWRAARPHAEASHWFLHAYREELTGVARQRGICFVAPPLTLHGEYGGTRAEMLAIGSEGGLGGNTAARGDFSHMNAVYGRACISELLGSLARV